MDLPQNSDQSNAGDQSGRLWVFFGTDEFSVKVLDTLCQRGLVPSLVVTVPDQPRGRKLVLSAPPAKDWAEQHRVPVVQPANLKDPEFAQSYKLQTESFDFALVASYGKIIPQNILDLPKHGTLNIHPSLLPKYRGATPLESVLLSGDEETGVTIIKLDAEMDHGPIVAQAPFGLRESKKYYEELRDELAELGANLLADNLEAYLAGTLSIKGQDHSQATFTKKISKEDGLIDLVADPELNFRKIRALTPWPGVYFYINKDGRKIRVVIKKAHLENSALMIERVVPEGKSEMDWASFQRGYLK
jgi:methionyl-tRNA formyltransferase